MDHILHCVILSQGLSVSQSDLSIFSESLLLFCCWFVAWAFRMTYRRLPFHLPFSRMKMIAQVAKSSFGKITLSVLYL